MLQTTEAFVAIGTKSLTPHGTNLLVLAAMPIFAATKIGVKFHGATYIPLANFPIPLTFSATRKIFITVMKLAEVQIVITIRRIHIVPMIQTIRALKQGALACMKGKQFLNTLLAEVTMQRGMTQQGCMVQAVPHGIKRQALHITDLVTPMLSSAVAVGAKPLGVM